MIPLLSNASQWKKNLFQLRSQVVTTGDVSNTYRLLVDSVYTKLGGRLVQQNQTIEGQKYECRLRASKIPATARSNTEGKINRRQSSVRDRDQCDVRMKIMRDVAPPHTVTIERLDEHEHTHDLEAGFRIRKPTILKRAIRAEVEKNCSSAQILHAVRGAGTAKGSETLPTAGGWTPRRQDVGNAKRGVRSDERAPPRGNTFEQDVAKAKAHLKSKELSRVERSSDNLQTSLDSKGTARVSRNHVHNSSRIGLSGG
jgi:hypothetical protein